MSDRGITKYKEKKSVPFSLFPQHATHTDRSRLERQHCWETACGQPPEQATARSDRTRKRECRKASWDTFGTIETKFRAQVRKKTVPTVQTAMAIQPVKWNTSRKLQAISRQVQRGTCQWPTRNKQNDRTRYKETVGRRIYWLHEH
jgi:hypothetical protein